MHSRELTFQDVKAYTAELVDVGVINLGQKTELRGLSRIIVGVEKFKLEYSTLIGGIRWSLNCPMEMSIILFVLRHS